MPDVPRPAPRTPLPPNEPVPSKPHGPNPEWADTSQRAGDLALGAAASLTETQHRKHSPTKHFHPGPLGFGLPEE